MNMVMLLVYINQSIKINGTSYRENIDKHIHVKYPRMVNCS